MTIQFTGAACHDADALADLEWLETDGLGGYASSSVLTSHTRRYHGLLVANLPPPVAGRHVLLSKYEESILTPDGEQFLTCHHYPGVTFPAPPPQPDTFELDDTPAWSYRVNGFTIRREILMPLGRTGTLVRYLLTGTDEPVVLRLKPLLAYRRNHTLMRAHDAIRKEVTRLPNGLTLAPYEGMPPLFIQWPAAATISVHPTGAWYRDFEYHEERRRGFDFHEDLYTPATLEVTLRPDEELIIAASIAPLEESPDDLWRAELARRYEERQSNRRLIRTRTSNLSDIETAEALFHAAAQLTIRTPSGRPALLAGYPWFEDWGRDTMIALPGTTFFAGRLDAGLSILQAFSQLEMDGLLPNYINPDGTACYNSVDASLWFFHTVQQYIQAGGELQQVRAELWPVMQRIVAAYARGIANPPVRMDADGLLYTGTNETQLTWMDAKVGGHPVTPRWGYAVEINALWYNALLFSQELATLFADPNFELPVAPEKLAKRFRDSFWLPDAKCLADCVNENGTDHALRPNQIFAVALPYSPLTAAQAKAVVAAVTENLLTPFGLRTLAPADPAYRPRYEGDGAARDSAYHQGTVWPWLLGPFVAAYLKVNPHTAGTIGHLREWMSAWPRHLAEAGLGSVSEIADGEPPHRPNGCISQAWSVGEVLRAYHLLWAAEAEGRPAKTKLRTAQRNKLGH